jgi:type IV secretory pathway VirB4 component
LGLFGPKKPGSTQEILKFAEIRDNTIILKDGNLRQVVLCSSINFALKSDQEQTAIIYQYQNFLNSLTFPVQILMQSKKLDLSNYLANLEKIGNTQTNELLKVQTLDYVSFVKRLIELANIMDKRFYIIVPFMVPPRAPGVSGKKEQKIVYSPEEFQKYKTELEQRTQVIQAGLNGLSIRTATLNTQQIIELLYGVYNPEEANKEKIIEAEQLQGEVVSSELLRPPVKKDEQSTDTI